MTISGYSIRSCIVSTESPVIYEYLTPLPTLSAGGEGFQRLQAPRLAIETFLKKPTNADVVCMMAIERPDLHFL